MLRLPRAESSFRRRHGGGFGGNMRQGEERMLRALRCLGVALAAAVSLAPAARAGSPELHEITVELGRIEALIGRAHFREAGEKALLLRPRALALPPSGEARRLLIRAELAAGTAAVALGQTPAARECFARALRLDPRLTLPASEPPKVRRSFDAARELAR